MDHPYYSVTVTNYTRDWTYTAVEGEEADPADPVQLVSPLSFTWGFQNGLIPTAHLQPSEALVSLAAHTAADVPLVQVGDLIVLEVRVGTDGPRIIAPGLMRVATAEVDLRRGVYAAGLSLALVDLSVDWRATTPATPVGYPGGGVARPRERWRERMAELGYLTGVSVGVPTWWDDQEGPLTVLVGSTLSGIYGSDIGSYQGDVEANLAELLNSHVPDDITHTWVTALSADAHPAGYEWAGPDSWYMDPTWPGGYSPALPDPNSVMRIEAVPATRRASGSIGQPLELVNDAGTLRLVPRTPDSTGLVTQLGLDADWCILPAKARRARDDVFNVIAINGKADIVDDSGMYRTENYALEFTGGDIATRGRTAVREVPTKLFLGVPATTDSPGPYVAREVPLVAANFLSGPSALAGGWSYDDFTLKGHLVPQDVAEWLLPLIASRVPGEVDGDGRLVRQVTIYDLDPRIRFDAAPISAFITGGTLTIAGGELTWKLATTPGRPEWTDAPPAALTVAGFADVADELAYTDIDPHLTWADLDYAEAS